ncbi:MAG TPA: DNA-binding response regulator [Desulfosporosinus sp.]
MGYLPISLLILGIVFLILGWRWQSPPNEEAMTALKGLAYLKREIIRVQDQVHILEDKIQTLQQIDRKESGHREIEPREVARQEIEPREKSVCYPLKSKGQSDKISSGGIEPKRNISPKYQEVLELAAQGYRIPEIAQHLLLSQDAVMMVLQTQSKGVS